jgi:cardiolipin synthase
MDPMRHLPNAITALRFLLIPVLVVLVLQRRYEAACAVFVVSALSDLADGLLARRWNGLVLAFKK